MNYFEQSDRALSIAEMNDLKKAQKKLEQREATLIEEIREQRQYLQDLEHELRGISRTFSSRGELLRLKNRIKLEENKRTLLECSKMVFKEPVALGLSDLPHFVTRITPKRIYYTKGFNLIEEYINLDPDTPKNRYYMTTVELSVDREATIREYGNNGSVKVKLGDLK